MNVVLSLEDKGLSMVQCRQYWSTCLVFLTVGAVVRARVKITFRNGTTECVMGVCSTKTPSLWSISVLRVRDEAPDCIRPRMQRHPQWNFEWLLLMEVVCFVAVVVISQLFGLLIEDVKMHASIWPSRGANSSLTNYVHMNRAAAVASAAAAVYAAVGGHSRLA